MTASEQTYTIDRWFLSVCYPKAGSAAGPVAFAVKGAGPYP
jgi:hypothetical protein